jgi:hypothetical protein
MTRIQVLICIAFGLLAAGVSFAAPPAAPPAMPTAAEVDFFESKIRPILVDNCFKCHSANAEKLKAELRLDSREMMLKGGESGSPAVVPGDVDGSPLITAIRYEEEALQMPPKVKLSAEQIAHLEAWVKMGAPFPASKTPAVAAAPTTGPVAMTLEQGRKFWSFVAPADPKPPEVTAAEWKNNAIDRFVFAKLAAASLAPSPPADRRTLIRRATIDLIGLPPTPAEIDQFEADRSPDAFEKVIDRLLASPHYGERWGRYWLDVARYADTRGYVFEEERRYAFSYTYRDWVIKALNADLPYDQFLIQQIAADRLDLGANKHPLAALGFLTLGRRFLNAQPDIIDDRIDVITRGTMALTVSCARCHDHKYDPIPTADYYSLYGVFASSQEPAELPLINGDKPAQLAEFEAELAKRSEALDQFVKTRFAELVAQIRTGPSIAKYMLAAQRTLAPHPIADEYEVPDDAKGLTQWLQRRWEAYLKDAAARNDDVFAVWRRLSGIPPKEFAAKSPAVIAQARRMPTENPLIARLVLADPMPKSLSEVAERYGKVLAAFDQEAAYADPLAEQVRAVLRSPASPAAVLITESKQLFGNVDRSKRRALQAAIDSHVASHPGSPQRAMAMEDAPQPVEPVIFVRGNAANKGKQVPRQFPAILSAGERKPFTQGSGRLEMAKLIASKDNPLTARVMVNRVWQYHFGAGLVRTPSDFGTRGETPTHPELLDFLAQRFVNDDGWSIKKLHKRMMLSAAYQQSSADTNPDGRAKDPENRLLWRANPRRLDFEAMRDSLLAVSGQIDLTLGGRPIDIVVEPFVPRRSIYAYIDRQNLPGMFRTFDFASPDSTNSKRFTTSVPQQALFMLNSSFVITQARKLAARPEVVAAAEPAQRVTLLYRTVLGRTPSQEEIDLGIRFIQGEQAQPAESPTLGTTPWQYGFGEMDEATQRLASFYPLPHYTGGIWQGGAKMPDPKLVWAQLSAAGGHPGNAKQAVIRRWIAPRDCTVAIGGNLAHPAKEGDGVRGRLVSSREGLLASWVVHHKKAETSVSGVAVKQGDTLDFVIDPGVAGNSNHDAFEWTATITKEPATDGVAGDDSGASWDSVADFSGPAPKPPTPLAPWEKYAQVLLESNEFAFVD